MSIKRPRIKIDNLRLFDKISTGDVWYPNTSLLLHFNGVNGSTNIKDSSKYVHPVTTIATAQLTTSPYKFGNSSLQLDGISDCVSIGDHDSFDFGSNNFTIEFWVWHTSFNINNPVYISKWESGATNSFICYYNYASTRFETIIREGSTSATIYSSTAPQVDTWYHVALVRNGTEFAIYINGTKEGTTTLSSSSFTVNNTTQSVKIGAQNSTPINFFHGQIDELRITKDIARYTANFGVPDKEFHDSPGDVNKKIVVDEEAKGLGIGEGGVDESRIAHAWVTFDGHDPTLSTIKIIESYNISGVTDMGQGLYRIHYNQALNSAGNCVIATVEEPDVTEALYGSNPRSWPATQTVQATAANHTTTSVDIRTNAGTTINERFDSQRVSVVVFSN